VRRTGKVVREQVELFGTFTGRAPAEPRPRHPPRRPDNVLELPRRQQASRAR